MNHKTKITYIIILLVIMISLLVFASIVVNKLKKDDEEKEEERQRQSQIVYATEMTANDMLLDMTEQNAVINYAVTPINATVRPNFFVKNGTSISLNGAKITPLEPGETTVEFSIAKGETQTITGTIKITVLEIDLSTDSELMCGKKANDSYDLFTLTATTNYPFDEDDLTLEKTEGIINVSSPLVSADKKTVTWTYNINSTANKFTLKTYEQTKELVLTAIPYINTFTKHIDNLTTEEDKYVLFAIEDALTNGMTAKANGHIYESSFSITAETQNFTIVSSNPSVLKYENDKLTAMQSGTASVVITATDGSNKTENVNFVVKDVPVALSSSNVNTTLNKDNNQTLTISTNIDYPYSKLPKLISFEYETEKLQFENNILTPITYGTSDFKIKLNNETVKTIEINVVGNYQMQAFLNATETEITETILTNQSTYIFEIQIKDCLGNIQSLSGTTLSYDSEKMSATRVDNQITCQFNENGTFEITINNTAKNISKKITIIKS